MSRTKTDRLADKRLFCRLRLNPSAFYSGPSMIQRSYHFQVLLLAEIQTFLVLGQRVRKHAIEWRLAIYGEIGLPLPVDVVYVCSERKERLAVNDRTVVAVDIYTPRNRLFRTGEFDRGLSQRFPERAAQFEFDRMGAQRKLFYVQGKRRS